MTYRARCEGRRRRNLQRKAARTRALDGAIRRYLTDRIEGDLRKALGLDAVGGTFAAQLAPVGSKEFEGNVLGTIEKTLRDLGLWNVVPVDPMPWRPMPPPPPLDPDVIEFRPSTLTWLRPDWLRRPR